MVKKKLKDTRKSSYQIRLRNSENLGVSLGLVSDGLCTIDLDDDNCADVFFKANPKLANGLITKGQRGCNVWVKVVGDYPPTRKFRWGEWRADGAHTVICGIHPEGPSYTCVSENEPVTINFEEIIFPFDDTPSLSNTKVSHNIEFCNRTKKEERVEEGGDNHINQLYRKLVQPYIRPYRKTRNLNLVKSVSFLFYNVSPEIAVELGMEIYDRYQSVWNDSRERHEYECRHLIESMERDFPGGLPSNFSKVFESLTENGKIAFRICRSLQKKGRGKFFLSGPELQQRMGLAYQNKAYRLIKILEEMRVISCVKKGSYSRRQGSEYRWILRPANKGKIIRITGDTSNPPALPCRHLASNPNYYPDFDPMGRDALIA